MGPVETLLRNARDRVVGGWCQRATERDGKVCAYGALIVVGDMLSPDNRLAGLLLKDVVGGEVVSSWNDAPNRTQEHVIAAFGLAIARAKRGGL